MSDKDSRLICLGAITGAHGVRGEVKIRSFTESAESIASYGELTDANGKTYKLKLGKKAGEMVIARVEGVNSREDAEKLRNIELFVKRSALPKPKTKEYYHEDLVGIDVQTEDGAAYGKVVAVNNYGAGDILDIKRITGKEEAMPFNKATFPVIDIENKRLVIAPPEFV